jgi:hypothetical protein
LPCGVVELLPVVPPQPTSITVKIRQIALKINGLIIPFNLPE